MNPFDRVHRTFAFKRILGSVEKAWGRFLNEAYLRRTYLRGRLHVLAGMVARTYGDGCTYLRERLQSFASERGKNGTGIVSPVLDKRKGGSIRVTIAPRQFLLSAIMCE